MNNSITTTLVLILLAGFFYVTGASASPAGTDEKVWLGSFLGDTLDPAERELYDIPIDAEGFEFSTFTMGPDSIVSAQVIVMRDSIRFLRVVTPFMKYGDLMGRIRQKEREFLRGSHEGARLDIMLLTGKVSGTLLSVRDTSILLESDQSTDYRTLVIPMVEIQRMTIPGHSNFLSGMGYGALAGAGISGIVGIAGGNSDGWFNDPGSRTVIAGIIFVPAGMIVGGVFGASNSSGDEELQWRNTHLLKMSARYPVEEPDELRAIR
jgi:hypothetical protein